MYLVFTVLPYIVPVLTASSTNVCTKTIVLANRSPRSVPALAKSSTMWYTGARRVIQQAVHRYSRHVSPTLSSRASLKGVSGLEDESRRERKRRVRDESQREYVL